jgi:NACHT domain/TIR domain
VHCRKGRYTQREIGVEDKEAGKYPMQQNEQRPTAIFSVCAPSDIQGLERWEVHLRPLEQAGIISAWSVRHLQAGFDRETALHDHLDQADLIVLLLSADFFTDDECYSLMERALARHQQDTARVIPLLLRSVSWRETKIASLTPLPSNGSPITQWQDSEAAIDSCVRSLRRMLDRPTTQPLPPRKRPSVEQQNHERMLRRLRRTYSDLMSQSLQGATWLELGLSERPDAIQNAANLLLRVENRLERPLPPGISITKAYDEAEHELLILGEPGAGKSTLLLDLAQQLLVRAEQDETHPLPVILPLSTWAVKRLALQDWMAEQISQIYDVPSGVCTEWVRDARILPLLDGLDEMDEAARPACIAAINAYHRAHLAKLVVCSRTTEYEAATSHHRLALAGAVVVQPLRYSHVDAYLAQAGQSLTTLRRALKKNTALHDLATTPLMLNILMLTYQGRSVRDLSNKESLLRKRVWDDYVERMVTHKGNPKRYPLGETRARLSYLAGQMRDHNQTLFYLEQLQPDWLTTAQQQHPYAGLGIHLPAIVIGVLISFLVQTFILGRTDLVSLLQFGVVGGLLGGLWHRSLEDSEGQRKHRHLWRRHLAKRVALSLCIGLIYGGDFGFLRGGPYDFDGLIGKGVAFGQSYLPYSFGMALGSLLLQYLLLRPFHPDRSSGTSARGPWKQVARFWSAVQGPRSLLVAVITGLSIGMIDELMWFLDPLNGDMLMNWLNGVWSWGSIVGLIFGLSYGLISLTLATQTGDIHLAERIRWTWMHLLRSLFNSRHLRITLLLTCIIMSIELSIGLSNGLIWALSQRRITELIIELIIGLLNPLSIGLSYWFLFGLYQGMAQETIEDQDRHVTNQGVHLSLRNSVIMGIIGGGIIAGVKIITILSSNLSSATWSYVVSSGWVFPMSYELTTGPQLVGISGALLIFLLTGGLAIWRHYVIRSLLSRSHTFPMRAPQFLNDATARILLRRIGGGYSFVHRLLLDHLADAMEHRAGQTSASTTMESEPLSS